MFKRLYISLIQFLEVYRINGLVSAFRESFYINRELIVLENDLTSVGPPMKSLMELDLEFLVISMSNYEEFHLKYPFRSRHLKAVDNLKKGYGSFVAVRGNEVVGNLWYATSINANESPLHHDLEWLRIDLGEKDAYGWDMYVSEEERENSVAFYLMSLALHWLREKGFVRIFGFVFVDNSRASFLYKMFKFKELKKMKADRFLFFRRAKDE